LPVSGGIPHNEFLLIRWRRRGIKDKEVAMATVNDTPVTLGSIRQGGGGGLYKFGDALIVEEAKQGAPAVELGESAEKAGAGNDKIPVPRDNGGVNEVRWFIWR
jgi:hypothetical protein